MVSRGDLDDVLLSFDSVRSGVRSGVHALFKGSEKLAPDVRRVFLVERIARLARDAGVMQSTVAAQWYDFHRLQTVGEDGFTARPYPPIKADAAAEKIGALLDSYSAAIADGDYFNVLARVERSTASWAHRAAMNTITFTSVKDPRAVKFARVPRGAKTCDFCMLLASRGFIYAGADTAGELNRYHANCDCLIVPAWGQSVPTIKGYDPDDLLRRYKAGDFRKPEYKPRTFKE